MTRAQLEEIATTKEPDLTAADMDAAVRTIAGSARSMGLKRRVCKWPKLSKRRRAINEKIEAGKLYSADEALNLLKELSAVKFNETIDVAINLGIDPRKSDQIVRGATTLPNGSGKDVRVCVFAQGEAAEAAKAAGAELVGMDELADDIKGGNMDFDVVIAALMLCVLSVFWVKCSALVV